MDYTVYDMRTVNQEVLKINEERKKRIIDRERKISVVVCVFECSGVDSCSRKNHLFSVKSGKLPLRSLNFIDSVNIIFPLKRTENEMKISKSTELLTIFSIINVRHCSSLVSLSFAVLLYTYYIKSSCVLLSAYAIVAFLFME